MPELDLDLDLDGLHNAQPLKELRLALLCAELIFEEAIAEANHWLAYNPETGTPKSLYVWEKIPATTTIDNLDVAMVF